MINPPSFFINALATTLAPDHFLNLATLFLSPEGDVAAKERIVGEDAFTKNRALSTPLVLTPMIHPNAIALLPCAAFQAKISTKRIRPTDSCTVLELCKVDDCLLVSAIGCFLERIFITPVEAIVNIVPHL